MGWHAGGQGDTGAQGDSASTDTSLIQLDAPPVMRGFIPPSAVPDSLLARQAQQGMPPVQPEDSTLTESLAALVARFEDVPEDYAFPKIERFELTGRQILIYISNLEAEKPLAFSYQLRAKFPLEAQTPASNAYDYYNPDVNGEAAPLLLVVRE